MTDPETTLAGLSVAHAVPEETLATLCRREEWSMLRDKHQQALKTQVAVATADASAQLSADIRNRAAKLGLGGFAVGGKLLVKADQASTSNEMRLIWDTYTKGYERLINSMVNAGIIVNGDTLGQKKDAAGGTQSIHLTKIQVMLSGNPGSLHARPETKVWDVESQTVTTLPKLPEPPTP